MSFQNLDSSGFGATVVDNWSPLINNFHFLCLSPQICVRPLFNRFNGFTRFDAFGFGQNFNCSAVGFSGFQTWSVGKFNCGGQRPSGIVRTGIVMELNGMDSDGMRIEWIVMKWTFFWSADDDVIVFAEP